MIEETPHQYRARLQRERRTRRKHGLVGMCDLVDADPLRDRIVKALSAGVSLRLIAKYADTERNTIGAILRNPNRRVQRWKYRKIMIGVERAEECTRSGELTPRRVAAAEYREILRRIGAAGWPLKELLDEWGIPENVLRDRAEYISPESAEKIRQIQAMPKYAETGPSLQTARYWRARGYLVPAAESESDMLPLPLTVNEQRRLDARKRRQREQDRRKRERAKQRAASVANEQMTG